MSQFAIIFVGLYVTLFITPIVAFANRRNLEKLSPLLFAIAGSLATFSAICIVFGISLIGNTLDAVFLYATYGLVGISAFQLAAVNNLYLKIPGIIGAAIFIVIPVLSIPLVLGVAFAVGDYEPIYTIYDNNSHLCRVTSYGNATTSNGGYNASVYRDLGIVEYELSSLTVEGTGKPEITPESVCKSAFLRLQS